MKVIFDESRTVEFAAKPPGIGSIRIAHFSGDSGNPVIAGQFADEAAARAFCEPWPLQIVKVDQDKKSGEFQLEVKHKP